MARLSEIYEQNKKWLWFSLAAVFIWGMAAHGYAFFNNSLSHDSLNEFDAASFGNVHKIMLGRIVVPTYRQLLRCDITMPWLIGLLSLLWLGLAAFFAIKTFRIESKLMAALVAGIFVANTSFSATAATYIHDLDCNMFAVLCAVIAVFLWRSFRWGWIAGAVFVAGALGIYQSLVFVAIALAMMACILDILEGNSFAQVMVTGFKAIGMVLLGGGVYYAALQVQLWRSGLTMYSNGFNSLDTMTLLTLDAIPVLLKEMYSLFVSRVWNVYSTYPATLVRGAILLLLVFGCVAVAVGLSSKKVSIPAKLLCLVLIGLLPLGMALVYILSGGYIHELMIYAIWLIWLLPLLLTDWLAKQWKAGRLGSVAMAQKLVSMLLVALILYGNVQFSNTMYLRKDIEYDAYLELMSRVVGRMENIEGYVPGQTPVTIVGLPVKDQVINMVVPGFENQMTITGMETSDMISITERSRYRAYFGYVLNVPLLLSDYEIWQQIQTSDLAAQMPCYPAEGFAVMQEGMLIVKLGPVS